MCGQRFTRRLCRVDEGTIYQKEHGVENTKGL